MDYFLGIDVGSVSTNIVVINNKLKIENALYIRTHGDPLTSVKNGLKQLQVILKKDSKIKGASVTGSARYLIGAMVNADVIKNEITSHAIAAITYYPNTKTIIEIGGQDSKIILIKNNIVYDFAMNNVCAAGTGSFLDQQASRLGIPIEEFGTKALNSKVDVSIAGRCTVFAESDMIHKQQLGYSINDIINGLCNALVRNYFNTVGKGKEIKQDILFQGGVAANIGIKKAFENYLKKEIIIPKHYNVMGALGASILALKNYKKTNKKTKFKGFKITNKNYKTTSFLCKSCPNYCEVIQFLEDNKRIAYFGDRCQKYSNLK
ncbi:MAG: acyl-CoA dehydratase activase [Nanoarchaeota archaeon]